jgi:hypothetical protein
VRSAGIDDIQARKAEYYQWLAAKAKLPLDIYKKLYPETVYIKDDFPARPEAAEWNQGFPGASALAETGFQDRGLDLPGR